MFNRLFGLKNYTYIRLRKEKSPMYDKNLQLAIIFMCTNTISNMDKKAHEESYYIKGLLENDRKICQEIYDKYYAKIQSMVISNSGSKEAAKDVFQDALIIIYKKGLKPEFILTCPFYNFLYPISKHIWLKKLNKKSRSEVTIEDDGGFIDEANIEDVIHETERHALYREKFALLGDKCRALMSLVFEKKKMREIAEILEYNNEKTTKQQHYKCKQRLIKLVREDSRFNEITD